MRWRYVKLHSLEHRILLQGSLQSKQPCGIKTIYIFLSVIVVWTRCRLLVAVTGTFSSKLCAQVCVCVCVCVSVSVLSLCRGVRECMYFL
jgi:hypothetical protein